MASKRPNPKAPPPASSSSSSEAEDEEQEPVAAKKSIPKPKPSQPPPSSSDDDDEEEDEEEGDGSSSSEEEEEEDTGHRQQTPKKPPPQPPSESDSESSEKPMAVANIKPINSKPMDSSNQKRRKAPAEPPSGEERSGKKPKLFQRFWSEGDEIKILRGILAFHSERGTDPSSPADMDALHDFMKRFIGSEFSKSQLSSKIRRLKKKHDTIAARGKGGAKPQDQALYEIAAKVWGSKKIEKLHQKKKKKTLEKRVPLEIDYEFLGKAVAKFGDGETSKSVLEKGLRLMDGDKAMALVKQLRELELAKLKNHLQWLDAMEMATQLIVDSLAQSG